MVFFAEVSLAQARSEFATGEEAVRRMRRRNRRNVRLSSLR